MTRTEDFQGGADSVRSPQFASVQTQHNRNFVATSVLDTPNVIPNQNGLGQPDLRRRIMGYRDSISGTAESTFDKQIWLGNPNAGINRKKAE